MWWACPLFGRPWLSVPSSFFYCVEWFPFGPFLHLLHLLAHFITLSSLSCSRGFCLRSVQYLSYQFNVSVCLSPYFLQGFLYQLVFCLQLYYDRGLSSSLPSVRHLPRAINQLGFCPILICLCVLSLYVYIWQFYYFYHWKYDNYSYLPGSLTFIVYFFKVL